MKTSANAFRDDRPNASAPGAARSAVAPLAPLLAGARARGVADGLELIGAAAALLDEQGEVLHLNARALSLLGDHLVLAGGRLRARNRALDRTLAAAIDSTLRDQVASLRRAGRRRARRRPRREDHAGDGRSRRFLPVAARGGDPRTARRRRARRLRWAELTLPNVRPRRRRGRRIGRVVLPEKRVDAPGRREYGPRAFDRL